MKYKVGDKVRVVGNNHRHQFNIGTLVEIKEVNAKDYLCYGIDNSGNNDSWFVDEEDITLENYTWEDFLKAPIGTRVTFEDNTILVKSDANRFDNEIECADYEFIESFNKEDGFGKIIKIEEPTYTTVYELEEDKETMPEIEEMKRLTDELCKTCDEFIKKIKEIKENKDE